MESYFSLKRFPYEEPYHLHLLLRASNGAFCGDLDFYCGAAEILEIGTALAQFPSKVPDNFVYEHGTTDPSKRFHRYFRLRAYTFNNVGHCALQISMNMNREPPHEGVCEFSINVEVAALNRLGYLLTRFAKLEHLEARWTPKDTYLDGESWKHN